MLREVFAALQSAGLDAVEMLRRSTEITCEFKYDESNRGPLRDRIKPRFVADKMVPVKNRTLGEALSLSFASERRSVSGVLPQISFDVATRAHT